MSYQKSKRSILNKLHQSATKMSYTHLKLEKQICEGKEKHNCSCGTFPNPIKFHLNRLA